MPSDERDDVNEEESAEEPEEELEPETEEVADTLSGDVQVPAARGGCSAGVWAVIIIIVAALIGYGLYSVKKSAEEQARKDAETLKQSREANLQKVGEGVAAAETALQQGDVGEVVVHLKAMSDKLEIMHKQATTAADEEGALEISRLRKVVDKTLGDINDQYTALQAVAEGGVTELRDAFGAYAPAKPAAPEGATSEEGAEPEETGGEQPTEEAGAEPASDKEEAQPEAGRPEEPVGTGPEEPTP